MTKTRRTFCGLMAGLAYGQGSFAQPGTAVRRVAVFHGSSASGTNALKQVDAFRVALKESGWIEGGNLELDLGWGEGQIDVMRPAIEAMVGRRPEVIAVSTATGLREVQRATKQIPIVFWAVSDPVGNGFVQSIPRPGGQTTGFSLFDYSMASKWLALLKEFSPRLRRILVLMNSRNPNWAGWVKAVDQAVEGMSLELVKPKVTELGQLAPAIAEFANKAHGGVLALPDPFLSSSSTMELLAGLALKYRMPLVSGTSSFANAGGLVSYGPDQVELARSAAGYVNRILKGESAGQLPVQLPARFELIVNAKTATALKLTIPPSVRVSASEVIR